LLLELIILLYPKFLLNGVEVARRKSGIGLVICFLVLSLDNMICDKVFSHLIHTLMVAALK